VQTDIYIHFGDVPLISSENEKCCRQICRENQNTHFVFSNIFPPENLVACGIMWKKNMVEWARPQMTILRMRFSCWIKNATDTLRIRNVYCFSIATELREHASMLHLDVHCMLLWSMFTARYGLNIYVSLKTRKDGARPALFLICVLFYVLFVFCRYLYCLCVNVY
jgi:hypothetical protein